MNDSRSEPEDEFVKNIEEESNEDDVEIKIDETIAAYNKQKEKDPATLAIRPESAGNRIQPATRKGLESAKVSLVTFKEPETTKKPESAQYPHTQNNFKQENAQPKKDIFYERFNEYVKANHIAPEDFWYPGKTKLNPDEFKECLDILGFKYTNDEFEDVIFDITDADFFVTQTAFTKKIECWKLYSTSKPTHDYDKPCITLPIEDTEVLDLIKENTLKLALDSKRKMLLEQQKKKNILIRPMSSTNLGASRPFSGISAISIKSKNTLGSNPDFRTTVLTSNRQPPTNKSSIYLKKAKDKETKIDEILALTINKGKNEFEYECLIKMGEANEISQTLGENLTYRAYKSADGTLRCNVYEMDTHIKTLNMKELNREYNALKMKLRQAQNLKIWDILTQNKKGKQVFSSFKSNLNTATTTKDEKQPLTATGLASGDKGKIITKSERQTELKLVLFETMKLTTTLKNQLKKLENSGLVYSNS